MSECSVCFLIGCDRNFETPLVDRHQSHSLVTESEASEMEENTHLWLSIIVPSLKTAFDSELSSLPSCGAQTLNLALQYTLGRARRFEWLRDMMVHSPASRDRDFSPILLSENNLLLHSDRSVDFSELEVHWGWSTFGWFVSTAGRFVAIDNYESKKDCCIDWCVFWWWYQ